MARLIDADALMDKLRRMPIFEKTDFDKKMLYVEKSIIDDMPTVDVNISAAKWIPVTERLPEDGETVLVYGSRGGIYTAWCNRRYKNVGWHKLNSKSHYCNPTHWMPLPEPPEEVE